MIALYILLAWGAASLVFAFGFVVGASMRGAGLGFGVCDEADRAEGEDYTAVVIA